MHNRANFPVDWAVPVTSEHGYVRKAGAVTNSAPQNPETNKTVPTPPRDRQFPTLTGTVVWRYAGMTGDSAGRSPEMCTTMPTPP